MLHVGRGRHGHRLRGTLLGCETVGARLLLLLQWGRRLEGCGRSHRRRCKECTRCSVLRRRLKATSGRRCKVAHLRWLLLLLLLRLAEGLRLSLQRRREGGGSGSELRRRLQLRRLALLRRVRACVRRLHGVGAGELDDTAQREKGRTDRQTAK